jgi:hypothetical protein
MSNEQEFDTIYRPTDNVFTPRHWDARSSGFTWRSLNSSAHVVWSVFASRGCLARPVRTDTSKECTNLVMVWTVSV